MIALEYDGKLGNQMFEFAFARTIANRLHTYLAIANTCDLHKYFRSICTHENIINNIPYLRTRYRRKIKSLKEAYYIDCSDCRVEPKEQLKKVRDDAYYYGFFQSVEFFDRKGVLSWFRIKLKYKKEFDALLGKEFRNNKTIVAHVRRGDYLTHGLSIGSKVADVSLPKAYYDACFGQIKDVDNYQIYFIGDDMDYAKEVGKEYKNVKFIHETEITDMQLLINADICIISNSTFAWWGAYLNRKLNKKVYAPKYFLGYYEKDEFPKGIYAETGFSEIEWREA